MPGSAEESLERIAALDHLLHSVIAVEPGAASEASARATERSDGATRGPLHGLPLLIKDNIDTAGELPTTAGSTALLGNRAGRDAPAVAALRTAGAVVVGKANLSEWANFRSTRSASGWSAVGGLTANPYGLDRSAGGSSSGSAAAVAAGLVPAALGTETDGSILCPAALCGCVGLKPTVGAISVEGVVPIARSQDTVGPITATVELAAQLFDAMTGASSAQGLAAGVGGLRVGVVRGTGWGRHADVDRHCQAAVDALGRAGAAIEDGVALAETAGLDDDEMTVLLVEFAEGVEAYLRTHPGAAASSLAELIRHNDENRETELSWFGQELFIQAEVARQRPREHYRSARDRGRRAGRENGIDAALAPGLDALLLPSYMPAWKSDLINGDPTDLYSPSQLPAVAGYPGLTVPVGLVQGLPAGVTLLGPAGSEPVLLRLGAAIEGAMGPLPSPSFPPPKAG